MNVEKWLNRIKKLDQLIDAKNAEQVRLRAIATDISPKPMDGMPFSNTGMPPQKMENAIIRLMELSDEINRIIDTYIDYKQEVLRTLEQLPEKEYGVLHRYYIRYMTIEQIAEAMGYSVRQILRIKKNGLKILKDLV